jgi:hypothetical protein
MKTNKTGNDTNFTNKTKSQQQIMSKTPNYPNSSSNKNKPFMQIKFHKNNNSTDYKSNSNEHMYNQKKVEEKDDMLCQIENLSN